MRKESEKLLNWASDIDEVTLHQAHVTSKLPVIKGHIALMPDAHLGKGATIGSVIPTLGAIIPSAVGVDIGCGMIAVETSLTSYGLPDDLQPIVQVIETTVPAGLGKWHKDYSNEAEDWMRAHPNPRLTDEQKNKAHLQFGSLGSGNHFFEVCLDERDHVWVVMHSGSRGVGNQLAVGHIRIAKELAKIEGYELEDPELAWLQENTLEFDAYIADMLWAQDYAMANRTQMMNEALKTFYNKIVWGRSLQWINCHHNFAQKEAHNYVGASGQTHPQMVWITRKGAIEADTGDLGVIPGSMGGKSYIVKGLGNPDSYNSCSHGAGRKMSRTQARKTLSIGSFTQKMAGKAWQSDMADALLDEHPDSYKDIDVVMEDQKDLVTVVHELHAIVNFKGTS